MEAVLPQIHRNEVPTPSLILDVDQLDANIATMFQRARNLGVDLRPHASYTIVKDENVVDKWPILARGYGSSS